MALFAFSTASIVASANEDASNSSQLDLPSFSYDGPYAGLARCDHLDGPTNEEMAENPGHIVVRYAIDNRGRAVEISILDSVPDGYYDAITLSYLTDCVLEVPEEELVFRIVTVRFGS